MPKISFNVKRLDLLKSGPERKDYWDTKLPGFVLRIPPDGTKTLCVPLSPQAQKVIEQVKQLTEEQDTKADRQRSGWVFPRPRRRENHIYSSAEFALSVRKNSGVDFRGHDFRRTAASMMASMGIQRLIISKILNHVEPGVTKVYDRYSYDNEKREALNRWGRKLMEMVSGLELVKAENEEGSR